MKNIKDTEEFENADFLRGNMCGDLDYISENQKRNLKSFLLSDRQEVLKMVLESLPKEGDLTIKGFDQPTMSFWAGKNTCLSEIKEIIKNLTPISDEKRNKQNTTRIHN